jgi:hypothetical protein
MKTQNLAVMFTDIAGFTPPLGVPQLRESRPEKSQPREGEHRSQ